MFSCRNYLYSRFYTVDFINVWEQCFRAVIIYVHFVSQMIWFRQLSRGQQEVVIIFNKFRITCITKLSQPDIIWFQVNCSSLEQTCNNNSVIICQERIQEFSYFSIKVSRFVPLSAPLPPTRRIIVLQLSITKTRLFKYIENFPSKNWKFLDKKL